MITVPCGLRVFYFLSFQIRPRKDLSLSSNSILLVSELPEDGFTEEDIRKAFHPFGNITDILLVPCRNEVSHLSFVKIQADLLLL